MLLAIWQFEAPVSINQITFDSMENFVPEVMQLKDEWIKMFQTARKKSTINKIHQLLIQIIDSKS